MEFEHVGTPEPCMAMNIAEVPDEEHKTIVVAGVPRGGTTMVAAAVHALGVYMGPKTDLQEFTFEDQAMHSPYPLERLERIGENNSTHDVWGWKDPGAIHPLKEITYALRNPRVILVFRDMLASVQGERRFDAENGIDRPIDGLIDDVVDRYATNWDFVKHTQLPTLLVSYERAIQNREYFLDTLVDFIGVPVSDAQRSCALERISPTGGYLKW